ncbi:MAG: class I SAM-dependent methyltransferase [Actinomycetota bacterium]
MLEPASASVEQKRRVRTFWEEDPCGSEHTDALEGSPEFYSEVERKRDALDPQIAQFANFEGARGERLLEIGVGLGTDFIRFVRAGAIVTGVDLTEHAVELVRRRLALEGLEGEVLVADAERLPFADESFEQVYSWGVLHHSPDTDRAVREAIRVLRPGGRLCVMLYARHSWVTYGMWVRHALVGGKPWRGLSDVLATHMESPGTKGYTASELRTMFAGVDDLAIDKVATAYDREMVGPLSRLTGNRLGWNLVVRGRRAS